MSGWNLGDIWRLVLKGSLMIFQGPNGAQGQQGIQGSKGDRVRKCYNTRMLLVSISFTKIHFILGSNWAGW